MRSQCWAPAARPRPQRNRRNGVATVYGLLALLGTAVCLGAIAYGIVLMTQKS